MNERPRWIYGPWLIAMLVAVLTVAHESAIGAGGGHGGGGHGGGGHGGGGHGGGGQAARAPRVASPQQGYKAPRMPSNTTHSRSGASRGSSTAHNAMARSSSSRAHLNHVQAQVINPQSHSTNSVARANNAQARLNNSQAHPNNSPARVSTSQGKLNDRAGPAQLHEHRDRKPDQHEPAHYVQERIERRRAPGSHRSFPRRLHLRSRKLAAALPGLRVRARLPEPLLRRGVRIRTVAGEQSGPRRASAPRSMRASRGSITITRGTASGRCVPSRWPSGSSRIVPWDTGAWDQGRG